MNQSTDKLIQQMAGELTPVKPLQRRDGLLLAIGALLITVIMIDMGAGFWRGIALAEASIFYLLTNGLLLLLGVGATHSVVRMANPQVGNQHDGPLWVLMAVALLPFAALPTLLREAGAGASFHAVAGIECTALSLASSVLVVAALFIWLRRGAPVSPAKAGLHLGVAATALGAAAWGLACPIDTELHLGIWHTIPVFVGALFGHFAMPSMLRW